MLSINLSMSVYRSSCHDLAPPFRTGPFIHENMNLAWGSRTGLVCFVDVPFLFKSVRSGQLVFGAQIKLFTLNVRKCLAGFHLLDSEKPARTTFRGFQNIFFSQCFLSVRNIHRVFANFPTQWRFWIICWSEFLSTRIHSLVDVTHFSLFDIRESTPARFTDKPCGIRR